MQKMVTWLVTAWLKEAEKKVRDQRAKNGVLYLPSPTNSAWIQAESGWNGWNGWNLVGMSCQ